MTILPLSTDKRSDPPHVNRTVDTAPPTPRVPEWPRITPDEVRRIVRAVIG